MNKITSYKKFVVSIIIVILAIVIGYIFLISTSPKKDKFMDLEIGKSFTIVLVEDNIRDYNVVDNNDMLSLLKEEELIKVKDYMKEHNLTILPGEYTFNQTYDFEEILDELRWEK